MPTSKHQKSTGKPDPLREVLEQLKWDEAGDLEIEWDELPHDDLGGFVDAGMQVPPAERTPATLLKLAQGLGRWKDVLQLLRDHPETFRRRAYAPLEAMANRELRRWLPALNAAKEGRIKEGRYPGASWLSPSYMHALIEAGDDIEALRLLGKPADDEPGFYDWLRGLALHKAGDADGAQEAFTRYFERWPGDVIGGSATAALVPNQE